MSKDSFGVEDDDLPPPYTLPAAPSPLSQPIAPTQRQDYLFAGHITSLRSELASEQASRASTQDQHDNHILALLIPHVEEILASIASLHPPPSLVETTLIPAEVVDASWKSTDDEKRPGQVRNVVRVARETKSGQSYGDKKMKPSPAPAPPRITNGIRDTNQTTFDGWGRWTDETSDKSPASNESLWWSDAAMAHRLASHLQPSRPTLAVDRQTVKTQAAENRKSSRWNPFSKSPSDNVAESSTPSQTRAQPATKEDITMAVSAREVTFRRENDFGLWESSTGWGIVVAVRIRR